MKPEDGRDSYFFDLDGTLARDNVSGYPDKIGPPVQRMLNLAKRYKQQGKRVVIFTARASYPDEIPKIKAWARKHGLGDVPVTNKKTPDAKVIFDDKAVSVEANTGKITGKPRRSNMDTPIRDEALPETTGGTTCPKCGAKLELKAVEPAAPAMTKPSFGGGGAAAGGAVDESALGKI